ncbi:MAG TPA: hypothetical protein VLY84_00310 [Dysgonamonadaceae bacterium]|nr:hypothetical protein [Dysgonamonadaceae bacterium]
MDLLSQRQGNNNEELLKQRFIARILQEEGKSIDEAQVRLMLSRGFTNSNWFSGRSFDVNDTILRYEHLAKHRFVDMRSRQTKEGRIKKKSHAIHNRIVFAHMGNIVHRLSVEYTQRMKDMLMHDYEIHL